MVSDPHRAAAVDCAEDIPVPLRPSTWRLSSLPCSKAALPGLCRAAGHLGAVTLIS